MSLETVRISQQGKDQLIRLKRVTGIKNWNVLCRWALCTSLADPTPPLIRDVVTDSNVEMTWKTFAGQWHSTYEALIRHRSMSERGGVASEDLRATLVGHLHRGIGHLAGSEIRCDHLPVAAARNPFRCRVARQLIPGGPTTKSDSIRIDSGHACVRGRLAQDPMRRDLSATIGAPNCGGGCVGTPTRAQYPA